MAHWNLAPGGGAGNIDTNTQGGHQGGAGNTTTQETGNFSVDPNRFIRHDPNFLVHGILPEYAHNAFSSSTKRHNSTSQVQKVQNVIDVSDSILLLVGQTEGARVWTSTTGDGCGDHGLFGC